MPEIEVLIILIQPCCLFSEAKLNQPFLLFQYSVAHHIKFFTRMDYAIQSKTKILRVKISAKLNIMLVTG
jgi:hypothetical protein